MNRKGYCIEIPRHHVKAAFALTILSMMGTVILLYGLITLESLSTIAGCITTYLGKLWFVNKMMWLFEDLKEHPKFKNGSISNKNTRSPSHSINNSLHS